MKMKMKNSICMIILSVLTLILCACMGAQNQNFIQTDADYSDLTIKETTELKYAKNFKIDKCDGDEGYMLITIGKDVYSDDSVNDCDRFLYVPENEGVPKNVPDDVTVLKAPLDNTYLVSTSAMDLIVAAGALSDIRLSGTKADNWFVEQASDAMEAGDILYAGKYSAPDYELIISEECNLAVENTMIYHNPEVKEKLEEFDIPVIVELSSYEEHPLGRLEWIKLYGALYGREDEVDEYFNEQVKKINIIDDDNGDSEDNTTAFFYVTASGAVNVRKPNDYISKMIGLAGGKYVFDDMISEDESALSTMNMQMEDFYSAAKEADYIIYNSTIEGELDAKDDLIEISTLFKDFKAYKEGNVYCTQENFFQETTGTCDFILDLYNVYNDTGKDLKYLKKLR